MVDYELKDKVAIVTGANNPWGIGAATALALAREGAQVLHDRCVEWGKEYGVPIQVLSSFRPGPGSYVTDLPDALLTDLLKDIPPG